jgi:hypothetical protein
MTDESANLSVLVDVTLDRKHLANAEVRRAGLPIQILLPGEFINLVLH